MTRLYVLSRNIIHFLYPANTIFLQVKTTKVNFWFRKLPLILRMLDYSKFPRSSGCWQCYEAVVNARWRVVVGFTVPILGK